MKLAVSTDAALVARGTQVRLLGTAPRTWTLPWAPDAVALDTHTAAAWCRTAGQAFVWSLDAADPGAPRPLALPWSATLLDGALYLPDTERRWSRVAPRHPPVALDAGPHDEDEPEELRGGPADPLHGVRGFFGVDPVTCKVDWIIRSDLAVADGAPVAGTPKSLWVFTDGQVVRVAPDGGVLSRAPADAAAPSPSGCLVWVRGDTLERSD